MGKTIKIISDFSGNEIDPNSYYGVTITNFSTKMSAKFFISHDEFLTLRDEKGLKPNWESWNKN